MARQEEKLGRERQQKVSKRHIWGDRMVENPPGEELSCAPRLSDASARKHLQTRGRNSNTWRSPNAGAAILIRRRINWPHSKLATPLPPPPPLHSPSGVKKFGIRETRSEEKAKVRRNERHVVANPISGGGDDDRRGFRGALHLKSQAIAKQAAASITLRKCSDLSK